VVADDSTRHWPPPQAEASTVLKLDDRDIKILSILQREGRIAKTALAERVNLSPTPCWERLKRLEQADVIEGYGAFVSWNSVGAELDSLQPADVDRFEQAVQGCDEILECWAVGGGIDYMLKFAVRNVEAYQRLAENMLHADIGLKRYFTYIVTKRIKEVHSIPDTLLRNIELS
jgi:Lrp/AsnC family transcriptional regulator of ectoine degradation